MSKELEDELENEVQSVNLFQQYRHAVKLARTTSRLKNKDWYRNALDLDMQLHCYLDTESGAHCYLCLHESLQYESIGHLDLTAIDSGEGVKTWIEQMLALPSLRGAKSLGVIFYLADDISTAGLGVEYDDPDQLMDLRSHFEENLNEILEDKTVSDESHAWRLFPYRGQKTGAEFATAVAVPRRWEALVKSMRQYGDEHNFPIRTCVLSAPLCAIASLPWCSSTSPQGSVGLFCYAKFSLLTVFDSQGELMLLRHIPHAQGASLPRNIGPSVFSTATAYELENPDIYVFPLAGEEMSDVITSLQTAVKGAQVMLVETADILQSRGVGIAIPMEMLTATQEQDSDIYPLSGNATFSNFKQEGWPYQDFYRPSSKELSSAPDAAGMKMLKLSRWLRALAAVLFIGVLATSGYQIWQDVMSETWQYQAQNQQEKSATLNKELKNHRKWKNLLSDRSKAWSAMELISQMVPDDGSIVLRSVNHRIGRGESGKKKKGGLEKVWQIEGSCNEKGVQQFEDYNLRDGVKISQLFKAVAQSTGNQSYQPDVKGRDIIVKFARKSNKSRSRVGNANGENALPYSFLLTIVQSFSPKDVIEIK